MTNTMEECSQSLNSAHNWVERLTVTIDTPSKNSKLLSSLSKAIDNSVEAYGNDDYDVARSSLKTASVLADALGDREWTNKTDEQKINEYVIPAIEDALEEMNDELGEESNEKLIC